ncbi:MAG TPA: tetratricopeptide repeat protein [Pyrinomonadaceae bacterium]|nr:tetratricopeptide repeat protein [Pyrinomonadaceae bacterium]
MKIFQSTLTFIFLLFILCISTFSQTEPRAAAAWQVKKYDITASISDRFLNASATLNLQNIGNAAGSRLTLRISEFAEISAVQLNGATATFNKIQNEPLGGSRNLQRITVNLPAIQPNATFTVKVDYRLKVDENSGLNAISPLGSQFLPLSFWYPTPNSQYAPKGADFAPFNLNLSSSETVISSGTANGTNYEQKLNGQPFFITGSWDLVDVKGITVYLPKGAGDFEKQRATELANLISEASNFTASLLGPAPNLPMRIVAVRRGAGFSDSGTLLLDYAAFRRQKIDSNTVMTIADSVAKIWLGNAKLVKGEGYGVIREGLSRYIATQFIEKQFGKESADAERFRQYGAYATVARSDSPFNLISPLDNSYFSSVANKGAMIWRLLANQMGQANLFNYFKTPESLTLLGVRTSFSNTYEVLDFPTNNVTDTNLLVGLPQMSGGVAKVAVRNTGSIAANVNVVAITDKGERLVEKTAVMPKSFGEVVFKTTANIIRTEIDPEKYYPQTDYSDDVAPREFVDSNPIVAVKRAFDKQDFATAEKNARTILQNNPRLDEVRTWLGRALLAENNLTEAEKEFKTTLNEKLPTPNTIAWANVGLADIALKSNRNAEAEKYFTDAIKDEGEYGATYAARLGRHKISAGTVDESVKSFFNQFDKAVVSARKTEVEALILTGEITRFAGGVVGGQPEKWETQVLRTEKIDANHTLAEISLTAKRLGTENIETGTAVFVLAKVGNSWKLAGVESFEVR